MCFFLSLCLQDMADYIAYVAKDLANDRGMRESLLWAGITLKFQFTDCYENNVWLLLSMAACHILECPEGQANEVINSIGQAFETRFHHLLSQTPTVLSTSSRL